MPTSLENRFTYHAPKPDQVEAYKAIRAAALHFAELLECACPPDCNETKLAIDAVDLAVMHANSAIARHG